MNIDRIAIRRLKTYGNYENVSVELSCPVESGEGWGEKFAGLDDMVRLKLAQLIECDNAREVEFQRSEEVKRLQHAAAELKTDIYGMRQWIEEHRDFVQMYESITGKDVDVPF